MDGLRGECELGPMSVFLQRLTGVHGCEPSSQFRAPVFGNSDEILSYHFLPCRQETARKRHALSRFVTAGRPGHPGNHFAHAVHRTLLRDKGASSVGSFPPTFLYCCLWPGPPLHGGARMARNEEASTGLWQERTPSKVRAWAGLEVDSGGGEAGLPAQVTWVPPAPRTEAEHSHRRLSPSSSPCCGEIPLNSVNGLSSRLNF